MPVNHGSDYSKLEFRNSSKRPATAATFGFWHVFAAVLLALVVHSLMVWAVSIWQIKQVSAELDAEITKMEAEFPLPEVVRPARPAQPAASPVPALPGTIRAREQGAERACINGRIYRRLSNGWDHIGGRCRATSQ